jgi:hypothetical protein
MPPVEVRVRSRPRAVEMRFGNTQLFEIRLDQDPSAEQRFALTRSENDSFHRGEYDDRAPRTGARARAPRRIKAALKAGNASSRRLSRATDVRGRG